MKTKTMIGQAAVRLVVLCLGIFQSASSAYGDSCGDEYNDYEWREYNYYDEATGYTWTWSRWSQYDCVFCSHGDSHESGAYILSVSPKPTGTLRFPDTVYDDNGTPVQIGHIEIEGDALELVVKAVLPASIVSFGGRADNLVAFEVEDWNTVYSAVNGLLLKGNAVVRCPIALSRAVIPSGVTRIDEDAFRGCDKLSSVTIPNTVKSIGEDAFKYCTNLASVTMPDSVERIEEDAFYGTAIWNKAANGLVYVGNCLVGVKETCPANVTIREGCRLIADGVFDNEEFWDEYDKDINLKSVKLPSTLKAIGNYAFYDTALTSIKIPNGVKTIAKGAFMDCERLAQVTLNEGLRNIGGGTFEGCSSLKQIAIPNSVTNIDSYAFGYCPSLTKITIGRGLETIDDCAFRNSTNLTSIVFAGNAPRVMYNYGDDKESEAFRDVNPNCTAYVPRGSTGWGVAIPGRWKGIKITYSSGAGGSVDSGIFAKALTKTGVLYDAEGNLAGTMTVKTTKATKKGVVKASATATLLNGKRVTARAVALAENGSGGRSAVLAFKAPVGEMKLAVDADGAFSLASDGYSMEEGTVGGKWEADGGTVTVEVGDTSAFAGEVVEELLPEDGVAFGVSGGRWVFAKAATVKVVKGELVVDESKGKTNRPAMKLAYNAKTGWFKGTFKVYALEEARNGAKRLKRYAFTVAGLVVDGKGYGSATCKKPAATWSVTVE